MTSQRFAFVCNQIAAAFAVFVLTGAIFAGGATRATAQTFATLHNFCAETNCTDGSFSLAGLIQGTDGNYYGTTYYGGAYGAGSVFSITPGGTLTTFYSFCGQTNCADGYNPMVSLLLASDGKFYGTTSSGGATGFGTIYTLTADGTLTTLYNFCSQSGCPDGAFPGSLTEGSDGNFYGVTSGDTFYTDAAGTVFQVTPGGTLTTLHSFCTQTGCPDGAFPSGPLIEAPDGSFYGMTSGDGFMSNGTAFRITTTGILTTLHTFCSQGGLCKDGSIPMGGLVLGNDGDFYGATENGGTENCRRGLNRRGPGCGTVFKISASGRLQTMLSFPGPKSGENPMAQLIQATDGNFYGATLYGGTHTNVGCATPGCGTLFQTTPNGGLKTVHNFSGYLIDGYQSAGLAQGTDGNFYGTTRFGGTNGFCEFGCGTVFSLSMGLGPFVKTIPASGNVGKSVMILGNNLTGSSSVTFNGTAAVFAVISSTQITATVPPGATTGHVQVMTPSGELSSSIVFQVRP
jgi:uncharacterized repeat protein (TIGR03803 family)